MTFCRVLCLGSCITPLRMAIISEPPRVASTTEMMGTRMCNSTPFHMEHSEFGWSPENFGGCVLDARMLLGNENHHESPGLWFFSRCFGM